MLEAMHSVADAVRHLWRGGARDGRKPPARPKRLLPVLVSVLAVAGTAIGAVLATVGGKPATAGEPGSGITASLPAPGVPRSGPAPARGSAPVVPMLGGSADGGGQPMLVPVARESAAASASTQSARAVPIAPLRGLKQADLLVVAPFSLSRRVLAAVARQPGVTGTEPIEAAKIKINGVYTAVLGVDPSSFRAYAAPATAASTRLWQGVADGGVAVSYTMGTLDRLSLGGPVTVAGRRPERLPVVAFGTVGIGGVDAIVSDSVARSLGVPAGNAIVISAPPASIAALTARIRAALPRGAAVEPLVTVVTRPGASEVGTTPSSAALGGAAMTTAQLTTALRAAESRRGLPYVWGAAGPATFDCSGLVQWSFAQAGISMPRVAADQARAGVAVPVSQLQPGDLLFYHTDPTDPGYISHVAIYLGDGWMIQAPQPGMDVQIVPASLGSQFAGAIRVYPRIAAALDGGLA
jgi:cell wall-associated NlpC family hydrolase